MTAIRLVPRTDDATFPYDLARKVLLADLQVRSSPTDFVGMIAAGKRMGWPEELVRANEALAERGRCLDFVLQEPPYAQGSLFEDNIFFSFTSQRHEDQCIPFIKALAKRLNLRVYR